MPDHSSALPAKQPRRTLPQFWRETVKPFWRDFEWPIVGGLALLAIVLGHFG